MGRGISGVKKNIFKGAAVAVIVILLVFAVGCSGDLLGYIKDMVAQGECKGIIDLPKTEQTSSHGTRDDGELQMGIAWPDPRFTDNGNGTITDNLTGLIWLKDGNCFGTRQWSDALSDCNGLAHGNCGLTDGSSAGDWRLPNRKELRSLINYEEVNIATWLTLPAQCFTGVQADYYWSSTTYAPNTTYAWYVNMSSGYVVNVNKTNNYYVLAVRSGQAGGDISIHKTGQTTSYGTRDDGELQMGVAWPDPRFTDNGDGTICDNLTGLMWEQAPSGTTRTWTNALTYTNDLVLGGHSDWRLPNVNELESLINAGEVDPEAWLNSQGFSGVQADYYWSSTTYAPSTTVAWYVFMGYGGVNGNYKTNNYYVLAVRSGQ